MRLTSKLGGKLTAALLAVLALAACAQEQAAPPPPPPPPAVAPAPPPAPAPTSNLRGKIIKLDGQTLTVKTREGQTVMVTLAANTGVRALARKKLSDIKSGDMVASTAMPGKDGKLHAIEVHFLPPSVPESQSPYDFKPGSLMTNAHVTGVATRHHRGTLSVTYKGQTSDVVVDRHTAIVGPADASMADLKPGKAVFLRATKNADGSYAANNVTVEKNGVKPPM